MRTGFFLGVFILLVALGSFTLVHQQRQITLLRAQLGDTRSAPQNSSVPTRGQSKQVEEPTRASALSELLRLRGEVSVLHRELEAIPARPVSRQEAESDWACVHTSPKPSEYPGFVSFTNFESAGFSTPAAALQSFYFAMRNQDKEPLSSTRMKQLWDVPDDFDEAGAGYSMDIGEGMGPEHGYRIVNQEPTSTNEVRLTLEFEHPDGSASRRSVVMAEHNGSWRMKPVRLSREN